MRGAGAGTCGATDAGAGKFVPHAAQNRALGLLPRPQFGQNTGVPAGIVAGGMVLAEPAAGRVIGVCAGCCGDARRALGGTTGLEVRCVASNVAGASGAVTAAGIGTVSYTHLTLPTICSV